jgi:rod shape-determining protein MreD
MRLLIAISFSIAFLLMVVPVDFEWRWCRPEFVVLLVIYWAMTTPQYFGLFSAWCVGFFQDLIEFSPLGVNAIGMMIIAYLANMLYARIKHYVFWHQALWIFIFIAVFGLYSNWVVSLVSEREGSFLFFVAALTSALIWPLLVIFMRSIQVRFRLTQAIHNNHKY